MLSMLEGRTRWFLSADLTTLTYLTEKLSHDFRCTSLRLIGTASLEWLRAVLSGFARNYDWFQQVVGDNPSECLLFELRL